MAVLEELTTAVHGIAEKVGPAVVGLGRGFGRGGSGVVVAEGRVVTNAHNLRSDEVVVTFADGRAEDGEVAGADPDGDLAVISVDTGGVTPVELGDGAYTGAGTVVRRDVPPGALSVSGGPQRIFEGWVEERRPGSAAAAAAAAARETAKTAGAGHGGGGVDPPSGDTSTEQAV